MLKYPLSLNSRSAEPKIDIETRDCGSRLKSRKLRRFLPARTRPDGVHICTHFRELFEAEACFLCDVNYWCIGAIYECEIIAQKPLILGQLIFDDSDHVGQSFFGACDRGFVRLAAEELDDESVAHQIAHRGPDVSREKERAIAARPLAP